jgi:hypothetical protein
MAEMIVAEEDIRGHVEKIVQIAICAVERDVQNVYDTVASQVCICPARHEAERL